jgi:hypothetical protein
MDDSGYDPIQSIRGGANKKGIENPRDPKNQPMQNVPTNKPKPKASIQELNKNIPKVVEESNSNGLPH